MRQTGFHSDLTAVLVLTAGQRLWWLDADVSIVLKIVPSMLRLWRQAFAILPLYVFDSLASSLSILLTHLMWHDFSICHKNSWKAPTCFGRRFLHYTDPGWAPHIYIQILSVRGKTSKRFLRSMYSKRTASTHTCFFLVYSSTVTKWLPASVSITTVTECRLPKRHRDERSCSLFAGHLMWQFNSLE